MSFIDSVLNFFKTDTAIAIMGTVWVLVEFWLGKTNLVKPGSTLEVVLSGIKKVLEFLKIKNPSNPSA